MVGDQLWSACNGKKLESQLGTEIFHQNPQVLNQKCGVTSKILHLVTSVIKMVPESIYM